MDCFFRSSTRRSLYYGKEVWDGMRNNLRITFKKGELTTQQIVTLIVLIVSFAVILFLLDRLNLGGISDSEVCHNSVVNSGKSAFGGTLNCKTKYLCISGGGNCNELSSSETFEINLKSQNAKNEVIKKISDEMSNCWWIFGEGKINYLLSDAEGYHCAICTTIKFDKTIQDKIGKISYSELYSFFEKNKKDSPQTYLQYFYGLSTMNDLTSSDFMEKRASLGRDIDLEKKFAVVTGINPNFPSSDSLIPPFFVEQPGGLPNLECEIFDITSI